MQGPNSQAVPDAGRKRCLSAARKEWECVTHSSCSLHVRDKNVGRHTGEEGKSSFDFLGSCSFLHLAENGITTNSKDDPIVKLFISRYISPVCSVEYILLTEKNHVAIYDGGKSAFCTKTSTSS